MYFILPSGLPPALGPCVVWTIKLAGSHTKSCTHINGSGSQISISNLLNIVYWYLSQIQYWNTNNMEKTNNGLDIVEYWTILPWDYILLSETGVQLFRYLAPRKSESIYVGWWNSAKRISYRIDLQRRVLLCSKEDNSVHPYLQPQTQHTLIHGHKPVSI